MPRPTLPAECKKMRTLEVVLTKHTEEDLWKHIMELYFAYLEEAEEIGKAQNDMVEYIFTTNPYKNFSWRNRTPKRIKFEEWMTHDKEDYFTNIILKHFELKRDFKLCGKILGWDQEDHDRFSDYDSMDYDIFTRYAYNSLQNEEFDCYERKNYNDSKKEWELSDAEWIKNDTLQKEHNSSHFTLAYHKEQIEKHGDDYIRHTFKNKTIKDTTDPKCKFCVENKEWLDKEPERKKKLQEQEEEEQQKLEESNRRCREEKERERKEELENRETFCCKECNYSTFSSESFDNHEETKEHKKIMELRKFYCEDCLVQCRNQTEYSIHTATKKHKIACGEIEKQTEFRCDPCGYVTGLKQNYDKHCLTKQHVEKTK